MDEEHGLVTGNGDGTCGSGNIGSRDVHVGSGPFEEEDGEGDGCVGGCAGVGGWGAAGLVEQIGGFFRLTRGNGGRGSAGGGGDRTTAGREHGFEMPPPRTPRTKAVASATRGGATAATVSTRIDRFLNAARVCTKSVCSKAGGTAIAFITVCKLTPASQFRFFFLNYIRPSQCLCCFVFESVILRVR